MLIRLISFEVLKMAQILEALPLVERIKGDLKLQVEGLRKRGIQPSLKVILVGQNPASLIYTKNKKKFCEDIGAACEILALPETLSETELRNILKLQNQDPKVHGLFVQLPLPQALQHVPVGQLIDPKKDVDGFTSTHLFKILEGNREGNALIPCTPKGVMSMLQFYGHPVAGKHVVIIGRSLIVGRPLAMLMTNADATVTLCHSRTKDLEQHTQRADIIVCALGIPHFLRKKHLSSQKKPLIIDVGINRLEDGKIVGDAHFDELLPLVSGITPVPGGVGKLTILSLAQNLLQAASEGQS